jgi:DNA ligase-1
VVSVLPDMATIASGQSVTVPGKSYEMKNANGTYTCSCPAWRQQSRGVTRTCKHIVEYLGEQHELSRVGYDAMPTAWQKKNPTAGTLATNHNAVPTATIMAVVTTAAPSPASKKRSVSRAAIAGSEAPVILAEKWTPETDPTGMLISEKYDGIRAYWDGKRFISRAGNEFYAPAEFVKDFPSTVLDGELYLGRGRFEETSSIVRTQVPDYSRWQALSFQTIDAPNHPDVFTGRLEFCQKALAGKKHIMVIKHQVCKGIQHLRQELTFIESLGGEGLMLRVADSVYTPGKTSNLLKVKSFFDSEASIIGYTQGKGQHKGQVGAFQCIQLNAETVTAGGKKLTIPAGTKFKIGSGIPHALRAHPPAIGTVITYRFVELTNDDIPRHATYVAIRNYE